MFILVYSLNPTNSMINSACISWSHSVKTHVVKTAITGMWQCLVHTNFATRAAETICQCLYRRPCCSSCSSWRRWRCPPLMRGRVRITIIATWFTRPYTGSNVIGIVETWSTLCWTWLSVKAWIVGVALSGNCAGINSILSRTVGISCKQNMNMDVLG